MINSPVPYANPNQPKQYQMLEDIQYSLCSCYIKYAAEKLAVKEAHLIAQNALLLSKIQTHSDKKELTELCTTEASLYNSCAEDDTSSFNSNERKTTFKRKNKYSSKRNTKSTMSEALQEIKEVCSQNTTALSEQIFTDYQKFSQQQHIYNFRLEVLARDSKFIKNRDKCQQCQGKVQALQKRLVQHGQKNTTLDVENEKLKSKVEQLQNELKQKQSKSKVKSALSNASLTYEDCLADKQKIIEDRCRELKLIENAINSKLQSTGSLAGCKRCDIIHQIQSQIMDCRKHYEKQFGVLARLLQKYKKILQ